MVAPRARLNASLVSGVSPEAVTHTNHESNPSSRRGSEKKKAHRMRVVGVRVQVGGSVYTHSLSYGYPRYTRVDPRICVARQETCRHTRGCSFCFSPCSLYSGLQGQGERRLLRLGAYTQKAPSTLPPPALFTVKRLKKKHPEKNRTVQYS